MTPFFEQPKIRIPQGTLSLRRQSQKLLDSETSTSARCLASFRKCVAEKHTDSSTLLKRTASIGGVVFRFLLRNTFRQTRVLHFSADGKHLVWKCVFSCRTTSSLMWTTNLSVKNALLVRNITIFCHTDTHKSTKPTNVYSSLKAVRKACRDKQAIYTYTLS